MSTNRKTLTVILVALATALAVGLIIGARSNNKATDQNGQAQTQIKITQPTATEKKSQERNGSGVIITNLAQDPSKVYVRAIVNGTNQGECELTFKKSSEKTITQTAALKLAGAAYTCQGFDVDKTVFSAKGEWTVTVSLKGSNKIEPASRKLNIE